MALHDRYARRTPFELAFPDRTRAERLAEEASEEAEARGVDPHHPQMFATLGSVGAFLAELRDPEAPPEAVHRYAALAFHGVAFARAGYPLYLLSTDAARALVAAAPEGETKPPARAGYLQLPQHLFWVESGVEDEVPESVDGLFWTLTSDDTLHTLLVTGVRPDRPGVGVIPVPEAPMADAPSWLGASVRGPDEGADFESAIPGADIDGLYGIRTAGEPLKLLARVFAAIADRPGRVERRQPAGPTPGVTEAPEPGPTPSDMAYTFIRDDG